MRWMISIKFNPERHANMAPIIPLIQSEQQHVKDLMDKKVIEATYISYERLAAWLVMQGDSQDEVEQALRTFPSYSYMQYEIMHVFLS